ncbi:MAG: hypothetical protein LBU66_06215 [Treponema sp.]|jgi:hypothetical protein|nr:hypothetical protein [Treponema sp.]
MIDKRFFFLVLLLLLVVFSVSAQDLIALRDGNIIEASVVGTSSLEVRYKRFDYLEGPDIVIPTADVVSIRYENGRVEIRNPLQTARDNAQAGNSGGAAMQGAEKRNTAMNPDRLTFGFSADPAGFAILGPSSAFEFTKGRLNTIIILSFPSLGLLSDYEEAFGAGLVLNYFWHSRRGGFYLGGMGEFNTGKLAGNSEQFIGGAVALSTGFKFAYSSGMYLRTGGFLGVSASSESEPALLIRPDISVGYNF